MNLRLEKLREKLLEKDLDALLVSTPENRRYVSGFTGSAGYVIVSREGAVLSTDFRYTEQAGIESPDFEVVKIGADWSWLPELSKEMGTKKLGFESQHITVATYQQITETLKEQAPQSPSLVATNGIIEGLRSSKDSEEVTLLQKAIDVSDAAMSAVSSTMRPGETEREVAWRLEMAMRELGADSPSFDTIVAAGPNGAMPHHRPSDRPIGEGEPIVMDMGARLGGYCSDITRTVCIGEPDEKFRRVYDIVLGSQLTAIATVRAGMSGGDADELSRVVISESGYAENFGHSLGHGVGLAVHEYPRVGPKSKHALEEGMIFTVEPGIYLSEWGGVRIEDVVVLEGGSARVMSKAAK